MTTPLSRLEQEQSSHPRKEQVILLGQIPHAQFHEKERLALQLATYFRQLVGQSQESGCCICLILPSVMDLSGLFHCPELEVLEAFHELQREAYDYEMGGLDGPVRLWDPMERCTNPNTPRWNHVAKKFLHHPKTQRGGVHESQDH